jgi:two-component system CheB/CheR fusion protein
VVTSITNRTVETSSSKDEFATALLGRLNALARSFGVLSRENWTNVAINELLSQESSPFGLGRFTFDGPSLKLRPQQALSLGMAIHELATNAAKYGALSKQDGRIKTRWNVRDQHLYLNWDEIDGPLSRWSAMRECRST